MIGIDYVLKAFGAMGILSKGIQKALEDGKATDMEKLAIINEIFEYLGVFKEEKKTQ